MAGLAPLARARGPSCAASAACQHAGASTLLPAVVAGSVSAALTQRPILGVVAPRSTTPTMSSGLGVAAVGAALSVGATALSIGADSLWWETLAISVTIGETHWPSGKMIERQSSVTCG